MRDKFDFDSMVKMFWVVWLIGLAITISLLAGGVYVIYKVLIHFGIF